MRDRTSVFFTFYFLGTFVIGCIMGYFGVSQKISCRVTIRHGVGVAIHKSKN